MIEFIIASAVSLAVFLIVLALIVTGRPKT